MSHSVARLTILAALFLTACQDDISTPFPPGLEPFEDNRVPDEATPSETIRIDSNNDDGVSSHGRGFVFASPERVWEVAKVPENMIARCSINEQRVMLGANAAYELSFVASYTVNMILTVQWDDEWRYGVVLPEERPSGEVELGMIRHQKIEGSDFIATSEGTVQIIATSDPEVTELAFVEHLNAISGGVADVELGMRDNYARLVAAAHGASAPSCP